MQRRIKSIVSKASFALGRTPKIEKSRDYERFIPQPNNAVITITADFELAWAWRYTKGSNNPYELCLKKAKLERKNTVKILELCDHYGIPITWATVGHLFLEKCEKNHGLAHHEILRLSNFENEFWKFSGNDWFEYDPCSNLENAPEWYCPDLIDAILNSKVKHEIGCHTFSHIDCRDEVCPKDVFDAEINLCKELATQKGIKLNSFVHPGHTIGNLDNLANHGFTSFQTDPGNILGYPIKHKNGLWELKRTYEFSYRPDWSLNYHIYRYKKIIDRAIESKTVCNFWFHPSFDERFLEGVLPEIFSYINSRKEVVLISTVSDFLNRIPNG